MNGQELPKGWESARLGELTRKIGSGATPKGGEQAYKPNGTPLIRSLNVHFDGFRWEGLAHLDDRQAELLRSAEVQTDDVLLNITGASIGRVTIAPSKMNGARVNQHVCIVRPWAGVESNFIRSFLASPTMQGLITDENYGVTRQALTKEMIENFDIPLPPLPEQRRIVEKIEALTARSRRAREALGSLPTLIDRYRQSILAAAFRGDLTEDVWGNDAPQLTQENGLHPIPRDWEWIDMRELVTSGPQNGLYLPKTKYGTGHPILRIDNFQDYSSDSSANFKKVKLTPEEHETYKLLDKDIVINRVNAPSHLGKCMVVSEKHLPAVFESNMMRLRVRDNIPARYIAYYLKSPQGRRALLSNAKWAVNQASINQGDVLSTTIPLPQNTEKMLKVVACVESALTKIEAFRVGATVARDRLATLDQSILAKAFRGELVPQDPNDEPASVLLERIRIERAAAGAAPRRGRRART